MSKDDFDTDRWCTPRHALDRVLAMWPAPYLCASIGLDPCWDPDCLVRPDFKFNIRNGDDALSDDWNGPFDEEQSSFGSRTNPRHTRTAFNQPPYSDPGAFVDRACAVTADPRLRWEVITLVRCAPDTAWWAETVAPHARAMCQVEGRYNFLKRGKPGKTSKNLNAWILHASEQTADSAIRRFQRIFSREGQVTVMG